MDTRLWRVELDLLRAKLATCAPADICGAVAKDTDEAARTAWRIRWPNGKRNESITDEVRLLLALLQEVLEHRDRPALPGRFGLPWQVRQEADPAWGTYSYFESPAYGDTPQAASRAVVMGEL